MGKRTIRLHKLLTPPLRFFGQVVDNTVFCWYPQWLMFFPLKSPLFKLHSEIFHVCFSKNSISSRCSYPSAFPGVRFSPHHHTQRSISHPVTLNSSENTLNALRHRDKSCNLHMALFVKIQGAAKKLIWIFRFLCRTRTSLWNVTLLMCKFSGVTGNVLHPCRSRILKSYCRNLLHCVF
jgi:hypothetical protein